MEGFKIEFFIYLSFLIDELINSDYNIDSIPEIIHINNYSIYKDEWEKNWLKILNKKSLVITNEITFNYKNNKNDYLFNEWLKYVRLFVNNSNYSRMIEGTGPNKTVILEDFIKLMLECNKSYKYCNVKSVEFDHKNNGLIIYLVYSR